MLQQRLGLRPGELITILPEDISLPGPGMGNVATIGLGVRTGTKLKRPQAVHVRGETDPDILAFVTWLKLRTPPGTPCIPYTYQGYRVKLGVVVGALGLKIHWTPHSPRAGFASEGRALNIPFVELRELGRWTSDSSLRIYIDTVSAAAFNTTLATVGLNDSIALACRQWLCRVAPAFG